MSNQVYKNSRLKYGYDQFNKYSLAVSQSSTNEVTEIPVFSLEGNDNLDGAISVGVGGVLTVNKDGLYNFNGFLVFAGQNPAVGIRLIDLRVDSEPYSFASKLAGIDLEVMEMPYSCTLKLAAGQQITIGGYQSSGGALDLVGKASNALYHCRLQIVRLG